MTGCASLPLRNGSVFAVAGAVHRLKMTHSPQAASITPAPTPTHPAPTGRGFPGEKHVFRHGGVQRIAVRAHLVACERGAFPWLHAHETGARATGEQRRRAEQQ